MWQYYAFRIAGFSLAFLPRKAGYFVAGFLAGFIYLAAPGLRRSIADNQRRSSGLGNDDKEVRRLVKGVLANTARNYFDLVKLPRLKRHELGRLFKVNGKEYLDAALGRGKGVVLVTAHMSGYDMAIQWLTLQSVKTTVLVEPINPPKLLNHVTSLRQSHGISFLSPQTDTLGKLFKCLHRGEALLFASDRDIDQNGIGVKFFGEETTMPTIAVRFALKTGAALVPVFSRRAGKGYEINFEPAVDLAGNGSSEGLAGNVERVVRVMERYIRKDSDQWVVLNRVWPEIPAKASKHGATGEPATG
ncbi:kdo(2)-lipid IV(A) lauroyltransferase [Dehalogenimonas formicexedens]|uniref:Kdo(2)-lipid IV(A) lauroyltransferase n=1 Tax=Dehalogenimonas formicexedens TaxID=1839801 RepID=A0A1P8F6R8_9CHLR|nr:lysophospholipid acyltransferase family protein [Dehalogenimonas formicexedens]APV44042.1 kdo(2)-lipid IV(A) lauroyltransferase [Dehalogenimonas formicexedens]